MTEESTVTDSGEERGRIAESRPLSYIGEVRHLLGDARGSRHDSRSPHSRTHHGCHAAGARRNPLLRCIFKDGQIDDLPGGRLSAATNSRSHSTKRQVVSESVFVRAARFAWEGMGFNMVPRRLWQMTFFHDDEGCDAVLQYHHALLDGMSVFALVDDFLHACTGRTLNIRPLNPPMEAILPEHAEATAGKEPFMIHEWLGLEGSEPQEQPIFTHSVTVSLQKNVVAALRTAAEPTA